METYVPYISGTISKFEFSRFVSHDAGAGKVYIMDIDKFPAVAIYYPCKGGEKGIIYYEERVAELVERNIEVVDRNPIGLCKICSNFDIDHLDGS